MAPRSQPDKTWAVRCDAMENALEKFGESLSCFSSDLPIGLVPPLLVNLRQFLKLEFGFFLDRFSTRYLEISADYPPEFFFTVILDQVANDFGTIQQAVAQRMPSPGNVFGNPDLAVVLDQADRLAASALQAASALVSPSPAVLTYFQRCSSIRVVPYANLALIGLPYACLNVPSELLAIPHEVGHYVYWHGRQGGQTLRETLSKTLSDALGLALTTVRRDSLDIFRWREEIFADIYGCRLAGPLFAYTGQDRNRRFPAGSFFADDGEHPAPAVRSFIYQLALADDKAPAHVGALEALKQEWNDHCAQLWVSTRKPPADDNPSVNFQKAGAVPLNDIIDCDTLHPGQKPVNQIATEAVQQLSSLTADPDWPAIWRRFAQEPRNSLDEETLAFADKLGITAAGNLPSLPQAKITVSAPAVVALWNKKVQGIEESANNETPRQKASTWLTLLNFEGWATKITGDPGRS